MQELVRYFADVCAGLDRDNFTVEMVWAANSPVF